MSVIRKLLPHVNIILSLMFITFFIVDKFNGAMNFLGNTVSKGLLLALALVSIANACLVIRANRKKARQRMRAEAEKSGQTGNAKDI